jgi:hypothetical protein
MERDLGILMWWGDRCCRAASRRSLAVWAAGLTAAEPEAGGRMVGAGWPGPATDPGPAPWPAPWPAPAIRPRLPAPPHVPRSATSYESSRGGSGPNNAALSRTARILLDTPAIPKYTFAPLTAGKIVLPRGRDHLTRRNHRISDENPALA